MKWFTVIQNWWLRQKTEHEERVMTAARSVGLTGVMGQAEIVQCYEEMALYGQTVLRTQEQRAPFKRFMRAFGEEVI